MKPLKKYVGYLPFFACGGVLAYIAAFFIKSGIAIDTSALGILYSAVEVVLAVFAVLLIHELGHALGGWAAGMRFLFMSAGPFNVRTENGRVKFGLNKEFSLFGGVTACVPQTENLPARKMMVYILGGPIAGLISGAAFLALGAGSHEIPLFLFTAGISSLTVFVVSLIPGTSAGFRTDGAQAMTYFRGGTEAEASAKVAVAAMKSLNGTRPSEQKLADLNFASEYCRGEFEKAVAALLLYYFHADKYDWQTAGGIIIPLVREIEPLPELLKISVTAEAAFVEAYVNSNESAAQKYLSQIRRSEIPFNPAIMHRVKAAILLAAGKAEESREEAENGIIKSQKVFDKGMAIFEKSLCELIYSNSDK